MSKKNVRKMVESIKTVVIITLFIALIGIAGGLTDEEPQTTPQEQHHVEQKYIAKYATSVEIDEDGVTTFEDTEGNMWEVQDAPTELGQKARLLFDSNGTETVLDDEIIDVTEEQGVFDMLRIYLNQKTQIGLYRDEYDDEIPFRICMNGKEVVKIDNFRDAYIEYNVAIREFENKRNANRVPSYR